MWKNMLDTLRKNTELSEEKINELELILVNTNLDDNQKGKIVMAVFGAYVSGVTTGQAKNIK